jgi:hypothetical protein
MNISLDSTAVGNIAQIITIVLTLFGWLYVLREKRLSDAQLRLIKSRGKCPLWIPIRDTITILYDLCDNHVAIITGMSGTVLHEGQKHVREDMKDGDPYYLVIENIGKRLRSCAAKMDGDPIAILQEPEVDGAHGYYYLKIPYQSSKRGTKQILIIRYETRSGTDHVHEYRLAHGEAVITRVQPKMPEDYPCDKTEVIG